MNEYIEQIKTTICNLNRMELEEALLECNRLKKESENNKNSDNWIVRLKSFVEIEKIEIYMDIVLNRLQELRDAKQFIIIDGGLK